MARLPSFPGGWQDTGLNWGIHDLSLVIRIDRSGGTSEDGEAAGSLYFNEELLNMLRATLS